MGLDPAGSAACEERRNVWGFFEGKVTRTYRCAVDVDIRKRRDKNEFNALA